ncbi:MAG: signal recognition particle receptor subunit alpha [Nanoarchaeota archaeon]
MLEKLSNTLKKTTDKIANALFLDKDLVESIVKDLQRALIEADVNVKLVLEISQRLKKIAYDERLKGIEKKEHLIKALHDELRIILGESRALKVDSKTKLMLLGLYGAGKTTTIGKLALYYSKRGKKVCTIGLDVHRPAATDQLKQLSDKLNITCFIDKEEKNPVKIWKKFKEQAEKYDLILIDTAGRDALDKALVDEIKSIGKEIKPQEVLLVMPADVGQTALKQAKTFKETVNITGVIITRMDSTAKAGGALTACAEIKVPVIFIGTGEKPHDLEQFDPESFLSRLLGMGDLKSLLEKIESVTNKKDLERTQKNIQEGKLTLRDVQAQLESLESMGSMDKIMSMIPGLGKAKIPEKEMNDQQARLKKWKHAINSMTPEEIENPEVLEKQTSRLQRIAHGSGTSTTEIRSLIKQYKMLKEMVKSSSVSEKGIDQKTMLKLAKKFGKRMKF